MTGAHAAGSHPGAGSPNSDAGAATAWLEDAARLLRVARDAAEGRRAGPARGRWEELLEDAGHAPQCRACPLCQGVVVLRHLGPDLLDQVSRVTAVLAANLRAAGEGPTAEASSGREPSVPRTEHIDITD